MSEMDYIWILYVRMSLYVDSMCELGITESFFVWGELSEGYYIWTLTVRRPSYIYSNLVLHRASLGCAMIDIDS